jgi:hypothetical protein
VRPSLCAARTSAQIRSWAFFDSGESHLPRET